MLIKSLLLLFVLDYINADFSFRYSSNCPTPKLAHGTVRVRQKSKLARFSCSFSYRLVGNRYTICKNGRWDEPLPVCIRSGCPALPVVRNALNLDTHDRAWVVWFCLPGYQLQGSPVLYCDGKQWNGTVPSCVNTSAVTQLSCDFEDSNLCGWTQDELHDFDWLRLSRKTPSSFLFTGPSYDHTLGIGQTGHYMYIESTSRMENNTARLLSPIFNESLTANGCFSFYYHMWGRDLGGLKVYQKPDSLPLYSMLNLTDSEKEKYILFEQWGNQGDIWFGSVMALRNFSDNFQIVIEGIRGVSFTSDIAIDDVAILQGENCTIAKNNIPTPAPFTAESCSGRCQIGGVGPSISGCGCRLNCFSDETCCSDFIELCMFSSYTKQTDEDGSINASVAQPQTERLVAVTTETTSTSTTPATTSTSTTSSSSSSSSTSTTTLTTTSTTWTTTTPRSTSKTSTSAVTRARINTPKITASTATITTVATESTIGISTTIKNNSTYNEMIGKKKQQEMIEARKLLAPEKKTETVNHSGAKTATITIASLCLCACAVYLAVWLRGSRARETLARLRGTVLRDPEVRYLNADVDDD